MSIFQWSRAVSSIIKGSLSSKVMASCCTVKAQFVSGLSHFFSMFLVAKYTNLFGEAPKVSAIHAGLECGLLGERYPGLDMISFGPTIKGPHSPDERVEIKSVQKFWKFLVDILKDTPKK